MKLITNFYLLIRNVFINFQHVTELKISNRRLSVISRSRLHIMKNLLCASSKGAIIKLILELNFTGLRSLLSVIRICFLLSFSVLSETVLASRRMLY